MQTIPGFRKQCCWLVIILGLFCLLNLIGCAHRNSTHSVTTSETYQDEDGPQSVAAEGNTSSKTVVTSEESSSSTRSSDGGIMGGAFHLVGEVLAFPFRVIAAVFDGIF